jgi:hypothetical protein
MSNRLPITPGARFLGAQASLPARFGQSIRNPQARTPALPARALVLSLFLVAFWSFDAGSTLAAKNKGAATANAQTRNSQVTGQLIANGSVTVNEKKAITGTTVYNDSRIVVDCAKRNNAIINLGKLGRIELTAGAKMTLRFGEGLIAGDLTEGRALISTPAGVKVAVNTPDGVTSSGGVDAAVIPVAALLNARCDPAGAGSPGQTRPGGVPASTGGSRAATVALLGIFGGGEVAAAAIAFSDDGGGLTAQPVSPTTP